MNHFLKLVLGCILFQTLVASNLAFASEPVHHQIKIELDPATTMIRVQDRVSIKTSGPNCETNSFYLHAGMQLNQKEIPLVWSFKNENPIAGKPHLQKIIVQRNTKEKCPDELVFTLDYSGVLVNPPEPNGNSSKSEGVVFSSSDYFYPVSISKNNTVIFDMEISTPEPWEVMSQGRRAKLKAGKGQKRVRWHSSLPSEEIFLIANTFKVYEEQFENISLYAFLLQGDAGLANRYIQTAKHYIDFYSKILGPYPYSKFALVENAKQTGYGMPSFTLMGSRIIRFPFILHSSYPHEILHNWWGNGVFADPGDGNWSEGLTAYLADHLLLELKGKGSQYRFQEMMKYLSYVNNSNEFPIKDFTYRDSMASQAIGYGKLLMVFHMLRMELGDKVFLQGLKKYFSDFKYRYASIEDMRRTFETVSEKNLGWFFEQWIQWKGAPQFELVNASYVSTRGRYDLFVDLKQTARAYKLKLPVAIWIEGTESPEIHYLLMNQAKQNFHFEFSNKPQAIRIDPYNEVFRKLDVREVPASIGQTFGAPEARIALPVKETEEILQGYQQFVDSLIETGDMKKTVLNGSENVPPTEHSLWVFGKDNAIGKTLTQSLRKLGIDLMEEGFKFKEGYYSFKEHSFVFTLPRFKNKNGTLTWIIASSKNSIPGLIRKLPHYGKYGYLVFKGDAPDNVVKGAWQPIPVSLQKIFRDGNYSLPSQSSLVNLQPFSNN